MKPRRVAAVLLAVFLCCCLTVPALYESRPFVAADGSVYADLALWEEGDVNDKLLESLRQDPPFASLEQEGMAEELHSYQMVRKADALGVDQGDLAHFATQEALVAEAAESSLGPAFDGQNPVVAFEGESGEELQKLIRRERGSVVVLSRDVALDRTIELPSGTRLDGAGHALICSLEGPALEARSASDVHVRGLRIEGGADYGIAIADSRSVSVRDCSIAHMRHKALVLAGSCANFLVDACHFTENGAGGLYLSGDCSAGLVRDSSFSRNEGTSNWMAGIVLTQTVADDSLDIWAPFPDETPHFPARGALEQLVRTPHDIVISGNEIEGNQSSGLYCDGPYRIHVSNNTIRGNDKEGMCLDFASIGCFVHDNVFEDNGRRIRQDDRALELDDMLAYGRLEDGSAAAKLPALSLDNALYNVVERNSFAKNWGGGVKVVRTAVRNIVAGNTIRDCNEGSNDVFTFIGIEIGYAKGDPDAIGLDFKPDLENVVVGNLVQGTHHIGVFLSDDSAANTVLVNKVNGSLHGNYVDISVRENSMQRDFVGTMASIAHRVFAL